MVDEEIHLSPLLRLRRVALEHRRTPLPRVLDRGSEEPDGQARPPVLPLDEEAHYGPDGGVVHRAHHLGLLQPDELLPGTKGDPADGPSVLVGDEPGFLPRHHLDLHHPAVVAALVLLPLPGGLAEVHAPATLLGPLGTEELHQVVPTVRGEGVYLHVRHHQSSVR